MEETIFINAAWSRRRGVRIRESYGPQPPTMGQLASARNRRDEENAIAFLEGAGFPAQEADVFLVEIDIEELADLALVVANMAAESREAGSKLVEGFRDGGGTTVDLRRALGEAAERRRDFDRNGHFEFSFTP